MNLIKDNKDILKKEKKEKKDNEESLFHKITHNKIIIDIATIFGLAIAFFFALKNKKIRQHVITFLKYIQNQGKFGMLIFFVFSSIFSIASGQLTITNLSAGLLYGFKTGSILNIGIVYIVSIVAFYISRIYIKKDIEKELETNTILKKFKIIRDNQKYLNQKEKGEFVALSRLSPIYPFQYISYFWGITDVNIKYYLLGGIGVMPSVMLETYLGSLIEDIDSLFSKHSYHNKNHYVIGGLIIGVSVIITIIIGYLAKVEIEKRINKVNKVKDKDI
jgi:uncharacterized membrane protein YdjX (TVP38/TMEM64 family)